ncbi:hypothetical protein CUMW_148950 [Citrus unshiu]|nr:hypothetical protein CUMW_148950 [Citrus unshiu]
MPGHINGTDSGGVVWMSVSETVVCWAWGCDLCVQRVFVKREGDCAKKRNLGFRDFDRFCRTILSLSLYNFLFLKAKHWVSISNRVEIKPNGF